MKTTQKTGLVFVGAVLTVTLVVVVNEIVSLSRDEAALEEVYERQMDTILFSVNQHSWDVAESWAGQIERILRTPPAEVPATAAERWTEAQTGGLTVLVERTEELVGIALAQPPDEPLVITAGGGQDTSSFAPDRDQLRRLIEAAEEEAAGTIGTYRPLRVAGNVSIGDRSAQALGFRSDHSGHAATTVVLLLDPASFVEEVVGTKLRSLGREELGLRIRRSESDAAVFEIGDVAGRTAITRPLWVFKDYEIGIVLPGGDVGQIARRRTFRSLSLVGLLAMVIGAGTWIIARAARRETDLAQMKSDFVSNVSHELRTPLSLISMYTETLEMGRVDSEEKRQRYYRIISDESQRLSRLVNNVLNFSRIESGREDYASDPIDLGEIAARVSETYRIPLERQGFDFDFERPPVPLPARGDSPAIEEAIINLVDNAVKYSAGRKHVTLRAGVDEHWVFVDVEDEGIGIGGDDSERVFEKFYRVESGLVGNTRGTGLGLTLVQHIVSAHGGSVRLRSEPANGSCFRIMLPLNPATPEPAATTINRK